MLTILHSNKSEFFKKTVVNIISEKLLLDPMQGEVILTESNIFSQWIQIELANYFGIAANIKCMNIMSFIKEVSKTILNHNFFINDFYCSVMYWQFMEILPQICMNENYFVIRNYLSNDVNKKKCSLISDQLVKLFSQYVIYHPHWLNAWRNNIIVEDLKNPHQYWQAAVWRLFLEKIKFRYSDLYNDLNYVQNGMLFSTNTFNKKNWNFPDRIFICGITFIPLVYWKILRFLADYIDIYVWFINPYCDHQKHILKYLDEYPTFIHRCQLYNTHWRFTPALENIASFMIRDNRHIINEVNCFLLDSWGKTAKKTLRLLSKLNKICEIRAFDIPKEDSLLHIVQKKFLEHRFYMQQKTQKNLSISTFISYKRYLLSLQDRSITLHMCHSMQREIEILHDNILSMIENDPFLLQKGIIVMAADIYSYMGSIQSVFNNIHGRSIPFTISSKHKKKIHPIISTFFNILKIPCIRCTAEEILSFLTTSSIASKFNIKKESIVLLNQWIVESGIRWGLDNTTMVNLKLPITNQNTWSFGLTRMLLGYAMRSQDGVWQDIFPYDNINEEHIELVGQLGKFLQTLCKWRDKLNYSYTLTQWMPYVEEILNDFFYFSHTDMEENNAIFLLKTAWKDILDSGIQSGYNESINIIILSEKLFRKFDKMVKNCKFAPNVVNFCDITPISCISCEMVCFLGMNDNIFPRYEKTIDFDLIRNVRSNGNYNWIDEKDYYAFFLALSCAKKYVYISYIGYSIYDNTQQTISVIVHDLIEYIATYFYLSGDKELSLNMNIEHIFNHLRQNYNSMPFDVGNFIIGSRKQSFAHEWVSSANTININNINNVSLCNNFVIPLTHMDINVIAFRDLYNFYRHPIKMWFQKRLGVFFDQETSKLCNEEPFFVDGLNCFKINSELLRCLIYNADVKKFYKKIRMSGILPYGSFGELFWNKQYLNMTQLANQIKKYFFVEKYDVDISLTFNKVELIGQLTEVQKNGLIRWKPTVLSMKDIFLLWIEHLTYCALGGAGESRLFGVSNNMWHFPNLLTSQAKDLLHFLILGYLKGMHTPLFLLHKSGGAWMHQIFNWKTRNISLEPSCQKKARKKLIYHWKGSSNFFLGESNDPYLRKLISLPLCEKEIAEIIFTAKLYFFNAMKYRIL